MSTPTGTASISACGAYRWTLSRRWDSRPMLLAVMFNPSTADASKNDPTILLLCQIASHNGFGGVIVVNAVPLRDPAPERAVAMARGWETDWSVRDDLRENLRVLEQCTATAGAVLLAWGALGARCPDWMGTVQDTIRAALPRGSEIYCLAKTKAGHPKHPMARGKHKVRPDAPLIPWSTA